MPECVLYVAELHDYKLFLAIDLQLYATIKFKMEDMQQHNMSWIEVQFLKKAVDVLCQCRQTLMFTYVFAFYLKKNNQSIIFEVLIDHESINDCRLFVKFFYS